MDPSWDRLIIQVTFFAPQVNRSIHGTAIGESTSCALKLPFIGGKVNGALDDVDVLVLGGVSELLWVGGLCSWLFQGMMCHGGTKWNIIEL